MRTPCTFQCDANPEVSTPTQRDKRCSGWAHRIGSLYDGDPNQMPLPFGATSWEKAPLPDTYVLVDHDRTNEGQYTEPLKLQIRHKVAQAMSLTYDIRQRFPRSWHINRVSLNRPSITDWAGSQVYTMTNDDFETTTDRTSANPNDAALVEMD